MQYFDWLKVKKLVFSTTIFLYFPDVSVIVRRLNYLRETFFVEDMFGN